MDDKLMALFAVIDEMQEQFEFGGSEDGDGALHPGTPDWDGAKQKIRKALGKEVKEIRVLDNTYKPTMSDLYSAIEYACYDQRNSVKVIFQDGSEQDVSFRSDSSVEVEEFLQASLMAEELGISLVD